MSTIETLYEERDDIAIIAINRPEKMRATIDSPGRLVVPKPIREALQLHPGTKVRFRVFNGNAEFEPVLPAGSPGNRQETKP